jgi:hypothetical protein
MPAAHADPEDACRAAGGLWYSTTAQRCRGLDVNQWHIREQTQLYCYQEMSTYTSDEIRRVLRAADGSDTRRHAEQTKTHRFHHVARASEPKTMRCRGDARPLGDPQKPPLTRQLIRAPGRIRTCGTSGMTTL